jgi:hypothetical protein
MHAPYLAQSTSYPWTSGTPITVDLGFLNTAPNFDAPEIRELRFSVAGTVTVAAANTFRGRAMAQFFQQTLLDDIRGNRINCLGSSIRQIQQREYGAAYTDPADIVGLQTGVAWGVQLVVSFEPRRANKPSDYRIPVIDLTGPGGKLIINTTTATGINANVTILTANVQVFAVVVDGGKPTVRSRLSWIDLGAPIQDQLYPINGLMLEFWARQSDVLIEAGTAFTAQKITSNGLYIASVQDTVLNDDYFRQLFSRNAADDWNAGLAVNVYSARNDQSLDMLGEFGSVQFKTDLSSMPAGARVVIGSITRRTREQAAQALGFTGADAVEDATRAVAQGAAVVGKDGHVPAAEVHAGLRPYLPFRPTGAKAPPKAPMVR